MVVSIGLPRTRYFVSLERLSPVPPMSLCIKHSYPCLCMKHSYPCLCIKHSYPCLCVSNTAVHVFVYQTQLSMSLCIKRSYPCLCVSNTAIHVSVSNTAIHVFLFIKHSYPCLCVSRTAIHVFVYQPQLSMSLHQTQLSIYETQLSRCRSIPLYTDKYIYIYIRLLLPSSWLLLVHRLTLVPPIPMSWVQDFSF